ncbi:MAG: hypothetical protein LBG11_02065 [Bifidobacteriaceae bacterium]|nr:hypothetical protein [Bifidobacteriaceae bacterium]
MTSLYAAGRAEYRVGPDDPSPGVASITAVMDRLNLAHLDQVIALSPADGLVTAQGRCRLSSLQTFLAEQNLALAVPVKVDARKDTEGASAIWGGTKRSSGISRDGRDHGTAPRMKWARRGEDGGDGARMTVGAAVIGRTVGAESVDVLTKDGQISRHQPDQLPGDALVIAAELRLVPRPEEPGSY